LAAGGAWVESESKRFFFEKNLPAGEAKNFFDFRPTAVSPAESRLTKVFCALFFKKALLSSFTAQLQNTHRPAS
jgi:hypothetical protein